MTFACILSPVALNIINLIAIFFPMIDLNPASYGDSKSGPQVDGEGNICIFSDVERLITALPYNSSKHYHSSGQKCCSCHLAHGKIIIIHTFLFYVQQDNFLYQLFQASLQSSENSSASIGREKPIRGPFSLFSRLFCCGSSTSTLPQNIQMGSVPVNHPAPSGRGSTGSTRNLPPTV